MWFGKHTGTHPFIELDYMIPTVSQFVYVYYLTFPVLLIMYLYLATVDKKATYNVAVMMIICFAISGFFYYFLQTEMIKPDYESKGLLSEKLMFSTWAVGYPVNCFPSQHCFMAICMNIVAFSENKMKTWFRVVLSLVGILVVLSTVFIKQHFVVDFIASLVIMLPCWFLVNILRVGDKFVSFNDRLKLRKKMDRH